MTKRYTTIRDITRNAINDSSLLNSFLKENFNQKKGIEISNGKVVGIDSNIKLLNNDNKYQNLVLGLSYVGRFENPNYISYVFNDLTNLFSTRLDYYTNEFYLEFEQVLKSKDGIIQAGLISNEFVCLLYTSPSPRD